jgi:hypothetical protein
MGTPKENTFPIRGLDLTTPGHQLPSGACRLLWDLVPTGRGDGAVWEVPKVAQATPVSDVLSLGMHGQNQLLALSADELVVVEKGTWDESIVWTFEQADETRRATFTRFRNQTFVSVTSGAGIGEPEVTLEVSGTEAGRIDWPLLPQLSTKVVFRQEEDAFPPGHFAFRIAWKLADGTIGPTSSFYFAAIETSVWEVDFTVDHFPEDISERWERRIESLVLICHPPVQEAFSSTFYPRTRTLPERQPGYIVARTNDYEKGATIQFGDSVESVLSEPLYDGIGLQAHSIRAGALYGYNRRLIVGDAGYDLTRPNIKQALDWEAGTSNAGDDDYHVIMQVTIDTEQGPLTRLSEPLPYDGSNISGITVREAALTYPDSRATDYEFYVSDDYSGVVEDATWTRPALIGMNRSFEGLQGSGLSYSAILPELYDFTDSTGDIVGPFSHRDFLRATSPNGASGKFDSTVEDFRGQTYASDADGELTVEELEEEIIFPLSKIFPDGDEDVTEFEFSIYVLAEVSSLDQSGAESEAKAIVELRDEQGSVLASTTESVQQSGEGTTDSRVTDITLTRSNTSGWGAGDAHDIRIELDLTAKAITSSSGDASANTADAAARVYSSLLTVEKPADDSTHSLSRSSEIDGDGNRIIWSEANRPFSFPAENLVYSGQDGQVLALQATGQEISTGQFGDYPIIVFNNDSVHVLAIGAETFVQRLDVITGDMGLVGRGAVTSVDGPVVACLDGGLYQLTPQLQQPSLSRPLNDVGEEFLRSLGPDVAVGHYKNVQRGRNDVWVAAGGRVWNYSIDQGAWSALRRSRRDFALRPGEEYAARADGALVREVAAEGEGQVNIQTAVLQTGPLGTLKRMRQVQVRQPTPLEEVDLSLVATDPKREYIKLESATLRADQVNGGVVPGAGLGTGFVLDIRGRALTGQSIESIFIEWDVRNRTVRDHQAHEYPAYLDAPNLVQTQATTTTTILVLTAENDV